MSAEYSREMLKISVAKMLQTLGWHSVNTTPVEIMTDILKNYICHIGQLTNDYANQYNCIEPNLDHLGLTFRDLNVDLVDLEEYIKYVDFGQTPTPVPKYPVPKEDHLNFLKPGSKEVVTRPVYVHEHLPPMTFGDGEEGENETKPNTEESEDMAVEAAPVFKRPSDVSPGEGLGFNKRARFAFEEEGRPTREISSVMMTTSGYLSPAREGKLPESRTPLAAVDPVIPSNPVNTIPEQPPPNNIRKPSKVLKKLDKKKEKVGKELFKPNPQENMAVKPKKPPMKDVYKMKQQMKPSNNLQPDWNLFMNNDVRISPIPPASATPPTMRQQQSTKINKALQAARLKTEKLNTTITPIPMKNMHDNVDKLFTEPDKKKVNIFKKISNVKNEKVEKAPKIKDDAKQESRESSPDLIIDESASDSLINRVHRIPSDITIEVIDNPQNNKTPESNKVDRSYFDDDSPPGTPSTPKTPEMVSQSPPLTKEKRKRKDKSKVKKVAKQSHISPPRMDADAMEIDLERPKTPEAVMIKPDLHLPSMAPPFPFFGPFNPTPGLIPSNPLFQHLPLAMPAFGQPAYMAPVHQTMPMFMSSAPKHEEPPAPPVHKPVVEKPHVSLPPQASPTVSSTVPSSTTDEPIVHTPKSEKKSKEHKKEKKDKIKKKNKKDKNKDKSEKKKLKEEKKDKEKIKKEKKEKRKEKEMREGSNEAAVPKLTLKLGSSSPMPYETPERKLNIKPVVKKEEEESVKHNPEVKREMSPELAKISALVTGQPKTKTSNQQPIPPIKEEVKEDTPVVAGPPARSGPGPGRPRIHPIKPKPTKPNNKRQIPVKDSEGNEVWICPACGQQDDGSPMIGCDDCDAWYHWFCVGIQVPPDDNENWYCRHCIVKKQEVLQSDKKKKRKKREKKDH